MFYRSPRPHRGGGIRHAIDFTKLRQLLGDDAVDDVREAYEFTWVGKQAAKREAATPINKTLRPVPESSVDWDTTQNIYIEGDNLDALKLLQKAYLGKVKMIYIDPPYNTGNDFVYHDDFKQSVSDYEEAAGNVDELGNRLVKNTESNGRFHSDWCSMIYPRLQLAKSLLSDDGVIFISIDDNEVDNLRKICDEVFGSNNHINTICVNMSNMSGPKIQHAIMGKRFPKIKEYVLLYSKNNTSYKLKIPKESKQTWDREYNLIIPELTADMIQYLYKLDPISASKEVSSFHLVSLNSYMQDNDIEDSNNWKLANAFRIFASKPNTALLKRASELTFSSPLAFIANNSGQTKLIKTDFNRNTRTARIELVNADINSSSFLGDHWADIVTTGGIGQEGNVPFENGKKPLKMLKRIIDASCTTDSTILDFFSGSATTAHAVMQLNAEDGGNRKFIMVQLPEETNKNSEAYKAGYKTICEIGEERIRRAGKKVQDEVKEKQPDLFEQGNGDKPKLDTGFRVYRIDSSNMKDVYFAPKDLDPQQLDLFADSVKEDRSELDLLYGCILDWGLQLSLPMTTDTVDGQTIYTVNEGDLVACFGSPTGDVVKAIAGKTPQRVLFRDSRFESDAQKINIYEQFKQQLGWSDDEAINNIRVI